MLNFVSTRMCTILALIVSFKRNMCKNWTSYFIQRTEQFDIGPIERFSASTYTRIINFEKQSGFWLTLHNYDDYKKYRHSKLHSSLNSKFGISSVYSTGLQNMSVVSSFNSLIIKKSINTIGYLKHNKTVTILFILSHMLKSLLHYKHKHHP